tara:strand:- start:192 stop:749 length:558 start_codon:yes stop_codon:yes gene_type:complete
MKRKQIIFLLTITISIIACGQSQEGINKKKTEESTEWQSLSEDKFEISHPSNWTINKSGQMGMSFSLTSPLSNTSDKFRENVNLIIQDLTGYDLDLEKYVELSVGQIKTLVTNGKIISNKRQKNDNQEYQKTIYTGKQGIYDLKFEQYYWVIDNKAFVLTLTCEEKRFNSYQTTGVRILNSFKLK